MQLHSANRGYWANRDDNRTDLDDIGDSFFQGFHEETLSIWLNPQTEPRALTKGQDKRTVTLTPPVSPLDGIKMHESSIPWDDVRIQEYGSQDFLANRAWVRLNAEKFLVDVAVNVSLPQPPPRSISCVNTLRNGYSVIKAKPARKPSKPRTRMS
jgi:hypothetical protein